MGEEYPDRDVVVERGEEALELGFVSALLVGREVLVLVLVAAISPSRLDNSCFRMRPVALALLSKGEPPRWERMGATTTPGSAREILCSGEGARV
jgi:hypothetical protein